MKKTALLICILFSLVSCSNVPNENAIQTAIAQTQAALPTATTVSTSTPEPTFTPTKTLVPSNTPTLTSTPQPTSTPRPSATITPPPKPITLKGTGDDVTNMTWEGIALAKIIYKGGGNFAVWNYDSGGNKIDLLVNTVGVYEGVHILNLALGSTTTRFQIKASGPWEIAISPLQDIRHIPSPGTISGKGDDVIAIIDGKRDTMKVEHIGKGNFAVWTVGSSKKLVINSIGEYNGTVVIDTATMIVIIKADGVWRLIFN